MRQLGAIEAVTTVITGWSGALAGSLGRRRERRAMRRAARGASRRSPGIGLGLLASLGLLAGLGAMSSVARAATIYVRTTGDDTNDGLSWANAKQTVTAGLAAATDGDQVWVAEGTYTQYLILSTGVALYGGFAGHESSLEERDGVTHPTILVATPASAVISVYQVASSNTRIDGFTIRGGSNGGIVCFESSPVIANNVVTENSGGGIYCVRSSPTIVGNTIRANQTSSFGGGGIDCWESSPTIANNTISGNRTSRGDGGGIYCYGGSPLIQGNLITGNSTKDVSGVAGRGGGICCVYGNSTIVNNTITDNESRLFGGGVCVLVAGTITGNLVARNSALGYGGGVYCNGACDVSGNLIFGNTGWSGAGLHASGASSVFNNTITGNTIYGSVGIGGAYAACTAFVNNTVTTNEGIGIYCGTTAGSVANNIVTFNRSGVEAADSSTAVLQHNCVYNPAGLDYSGVAPGVGDITADPLFVRSPSPGADGAWGTDDDDYGDLRLTAGSPCIDAGSNAAVPTGIVVDLDGTPRFLDDPATPDCRWAPGTCGAAPIVDMGAYEFMAGDYDRDGDVDADDLAAFQACVSGPMVGFSGDCLGADLDRDGDVDNGDFGVFQRCFRGAKDAAVAGH